MVQDKQEELNTIGFYVFELLDLWSSFKKYL